MSHIEYKLAIKAVEEDRSKRLQAQDLNQFIFAEALYSLNSFFTQVVTSNEKETALESLPQTCLQVLVIAKKVGSKSKEFNFEAVY